MGTAVTNQINLSGRGWSSQPSAFFPCCHLKLYCILKPKTSSFRIHLRQPIYIINSTDKTKSVSCRLPLPNRRRATVSSEMNPFIHPEKPSYVNQHYQVVLKCLNNVIYISLFEVKKKGESSLITPEWRQNKHSGGSLPSNRSKSNQL